MKIGELSKRSGVSVRMLRYYEGEGLLRPQRTDAGYRDYGPAEEETVRRIKLLGSAGMTLGTIQKLLPCVQSDYPAFTPCDDLRRILTEQVTILDARIETLARSRSILAGFLSIAG
ncbi:MerR family transcriptional regulator [Sphingomonas sp. GM_Shp_2]|uniref:MerR family transcriptional regulator n=1 Tax=Sphingomonas sp. GM_Shp_2 TaxID=2937380 RepID=UPI00226A5A96